MQSTLTQSRPDPIAKFTLIGSVAGVLCLAWLGVQAATVPMPAGAAPVTLVATPQPAQAEAFDAVPAPADPAPTADPAPPPSDPAPEAAPVMSVPTAEPPVIAAAPPTAADAPASAAVQSAPLQPEYAAVIQAQAAHSPRGDVEVAAPAPVEVPLPSGAVVLNPAPAPEPSQVDPNAHAVPAAPLGAEYAENIQARQSNSCPDGQVFYPRSGCHAPGSGGTQPWPNGR